MILLKFSWSKTTSYRYRRLIDMANYNRGILGVMWLVSLVSYCTTLEHVAGEECVALLGKFFFRWINFLSYNNCLLWFDPFCAHTFFYIRFMAQWIGQISLFCNSIVSSIIFQCVNAYKTLFLSTNESGKKHRARVFVFLWDIWAFFNNREGW